MLYFVNTLGAGIGALLAAFVFLGLLGLSGSVYLAVALNVFAGLLILPPSADARAQPHEPALHRRPVPRRPHRLHLAQLRDLLGAAVFLRHRVARLGVWRDVRHLPHRAGTRLALEPALPGRRRRPQPEAPRPRCRCSCSPPTPSVSSSSRRCRGWPRWSPTGRSTPAAGAAGSYSRCRWWRLPPP